PTQTSAAGQQGIRMVQRRTGDPSNIPTPIPISGYAPIHPSTRSASQGEAMRRRWIVLGWFIAITALWAFANLPHDGGSLKPFLRWAGFPWTFASWDSGRLDRFDPALLAADVALGFALATGVAAVCVWSRSRSTNRAD